MLEKVLSIEYSNFTDDNGKINTAEGYYTVDESGNINSDICYYISEKGYLKPNPNILKVYNKFDEQIATDDLPVYDDCDLVLFAANFQTDWNTFFEKFLSKASDTVRLDVDDYFTSAAYMLLVYYNYINCDLMDLQSELIELLISKLQGKSIEYIESFWKSFDFKDYFSFDTYLKYDQKICIIENLWAELKEELEDEGIDVGTLEHTYYALKKRSGLLFDNCDGANNDIINLIEKFKLNTKQNDLTKIRFFIDDDEFESIEFELDSYQLTTVFGEKCVLFKYRADFNSLRTEDDEDDDSYYYTLPNEVCVFYPDKDGYNLIVGDMDDFTILYDLLKKYKELYIGFHYLPIQDVNNTMPFLMYMKHLSDNNICDMKNRYYVVAKSGDRYIIEYNPDDKQYHFLIEDGKIKHYSFDATDMMVHDIPYKWYTFEYFDALVAMSMNLSFADFSDAFTDSENTNIGCKFVYTDGTSMEEYPDDLFAVLDKTDDLLDAILVLENGSVPDAEYITSLKNIDLSELTKTFTTEIDKDFGEAFKMALIQNALNEHPECESYEDLPDDVKLEIEESEDDYLDIDMGEHIHDEILMGKTTNNEKYMHYNYKLPSTDIDESDFIANYRKIPLIANNPDLEVK